MAKIKAEEVAGAAAGLGILGGCGLTVLIVLAIKLLVIGVILWAIIKLVQHFT